MNREIKFRGKRIEDGRWLYGDLYHTDDLTCICDWTTQPHTVENLAVDPATVGQYTGHKDRNYKEIYEGDLIEYCYGVYSFGAIWQTVRIEYRANEGGYVGINQSRKTHDGRDIVQNIVRCLDKCIVRGNIHDNLELLNRE